jgi:hypothetical protein
MRNLLIELGQYATYTFTIATAWDTLPTSCWPVAGSAMVCSHIVIVIVLMGFLNIGFWLV